VGVDFKGTSTIAGWGISAARQGTDIKERASGF
jgi:hypothetical protein